MKPFARVTKEGLLLQILVQPKASKVGWDHVTEDGRIKLKIQAPPVDGAANEACIKWLSKQFKCPKSLIELKRGDRSREKTFLLPSYQQSKLDEFLQTYENEPHS